MSTALISSFYDVGDVLFQNRRNNQLKSQQGTDRRMIAPINSFTKNRHFSTGSGSAFVPVTGRGSTVNNIVPGPNMMQISPKDNLNPINREHKKLDRSMSEPTGDRLNRNNGNINSTRYKTELCRPFEESGHCKYGDKCQFAHGSTEQRNLARHPKYKTELCRTFHTIGFCPYGPRCHFIHNEDERRLNHLVNKNHQANTQIPPSVQPPTPIQRPKSIKFNSLSSLGSSMDSPPSSLTGSPTSLSPTFFSEDIFSSSSLPFPGNSRTSSGSSRSSPVFNYSPVTDLGTHSSLMTPLNVQTQLNNVNAAVDLASLQQQFSNVMNLNQRNNNHQNVFEEENLIFRENVQCSNDVFSAPPSSPESISGDSVGSTGSSSYSTCGSPLEVGKTLRLPIFNRLSQDDI